MRAVIIYCAFLLLGLTNEVAAQVSRVVPTTDKTDLKKELFKYLVATKQADKADEVKVMYQIDLLTKASTSGVGIYKFGLESAHAGYKGFLFQKDTVGELVLG